MIDVGGDVGNGRNGLARVPVGNRHVDEGRSQGERNEQHGTAAETELRELRSAGAVFGLLDIDDEFFVIVRPAPSGTRLLLSDATAALDSGLALAYCSLAVYPPDIQIPVAAVARYWGQLRGSSLGLARSRSTRSFSWTMGGWPPAARTPNCSVRAACTATCGAGDSSGSSPSARSAH